VHLAKAGQAVPPDGIRYPETGRHRRAVRADIQAPVVRVSVERAQPVHRNRADQLAHSLVGVPDRLPVAVHIQALVGGMPVVAARPGNPAAADGRPAVEAARPAALDVASVHRRHAGPEPAVQAEVRVPAQAGVLVQVPPREPEAEALLVAVPGLQGLAQAWPSRPVQPRLPSWQRKTSRGLQFLLFS
jgi:hypothetical protein